MEPNLDARITDRWFQIPDAAKYHEVQRLWIHNFFKSYIQYHIVAAGRRSYKTERMKRMIALLAMLSEDKRYFLGAPTRQQAKDIFWNDIQDLIPDRLIQNTNKTELKVTLVSGSSISVIGLVEYHRIEGIMWHGCGISEYQEVDAEFFGRTLQPILNDTGGKAILEGRPLGKNHFYDAFERSKVEPERWASYTWKSSDVLSVGQIEAAKRDLAIEDYRREYEASFEAGGQRAYYAFSEKNIQGFELDKSHVIVTCDFNATEKPMSWCICDNPTGTVRVWNSYSYAYTNTETMCTKFISIFDEIGWPARITFYGDYSGVKNTSNSSWNDWDIIGRMFQGKNIEIKKRPCLSVRNRVGAVNAMLCNTLGEIRMIVHPQAKSLIRDFERVEWAANSVELNQKTDVTLTHTSDGVGYYIDVEFPITPRQTRSN